MKRLIFCSSFVALLALSWNPGFERSRADAVKTSGSGKMTFKLLYDSSHLPPEAQKVIQRDAAEHLTAAHGGFAVDLRPGKGETYFGLKGIGIIQISGDLKKTRILNTPDEVKNSNLHNAAIWTAADGKRYLSFPSNDANAIFTTTLDGKLMNVLHTPEPGIDLGDPTVNTYFKEQGKFIPTDVEQLDGLLYMTTGYSKLDFVLTAKIVSTNPFNVVWHDLSFGGKGKGVGQFMTGHGITIPPGTTRLEVSDRPDSRIERFTRYGHYLSTFELPPGSLPCDIYYLGKYAIVGALDGPDKTKGAPIYILEDDKVISTIMVKEDLGLPNFKHVHNAVFREVGGKLYIIAYAWNPGDFAILEQVGD